MKQHMRRSAVAPALIVGVAVGHALGATSAGAEPGVTSDSQSLADAITDGLKPHPDLEGDTVPGVDYTAVASRHDEVTNPSLSAVDPIGHPALNCTFNPWLIGAGETL
ncbi:hypothetical protein ACFQ9R_01160 [Nocardia sp. NPDC056541]|uniref:hypothetical protein n=1 Tax=Nocardia sp. NPDC056541 TaxID=3345860 RepID=UPI00366AD749